MSLATLTRLFAGLMWLLACGALQAANPETALVGAVKRSDLRSVRSLLQAHVDVNAPEADGSTALAWAVHRGDLEASQLLIQFGANVNASNDYGVSPLSLACENRSSLFIDTLLKAGADTTNVNPLSGETPLMRCARTGSIDAVRLLLEAGAEINRTESAGGQSALMWAAAEGHPDVVELLLERGASVSARSTHGFTPLLFAAQKGDVAEARLLLAVGAQWTEATPDGDSALLIAADSGQEMFCLFALEAGADPNVADRFGLTALHFAVLRGLPLIRGGIYHSFLSPLWRPNMSKLVNALLAHGANPNARISAALPANRFYRDERGKVGYLGATPFLLAAATNDLGIMRALAAAGADCRLGTNSGTTPLMVAAGLGNKQLPTDDGWNVSRTSSLEAVKLAMALGGDVKAANAEGHTALHAAAYKGLDEVIEWLVKHGAEVDAKDEYGQTPWSIAALVLLPGVERDWSPTILNQGAADLLLKLGARQLRANDAAQGVKVSAGKM